MNDRRATDGRRQAKGWKHPVSECPGCGKIINATSDAKNRGRPRPGDLTLAICCGTILRFDLLLKLKAVTPAELEALPQSTLAELKEQQDRWRIHTGGAKLIALPPRKPS